MSSCFGSRKKRARDDDTQPLLPRYEDDTILTRTAHQKMHTYQMFKALSKGFMPSTEQTIINLRTLLASDLLNPDTVGLSRSGKALIKYTRQWLSYFIEFLRYKNGDDQIQDFIWYLIHAKIQIDAEDLSRNLVETVTSTRAKADASAAFESVKTVGSLLLTNSDFRMFLSDLNTIGKHVFADTAHTLSGVAEDAANLIEPTEEESAALKTHGGESGPISQEELMVEAVEITDVVADGVKKTGIEAGKSLKENISGEQKENLLFRLKAAVTKLRRRTDYSDSASTIGLLIQRYAKVYSRAVDETIGAVQDDFHTNPELDRAVKNAWLLLSSFGDKQHWDELEKRVHRVMGHSHADPDFENMMGELAASVQKMLTDPDFFEQAGDTLIDLKEKSKEVGTESPLRKDIDALLQQVRRTMSSVFSDEHVSQLIQTSILLWKILSPVNTFSTQELLQDAYTIFIPMLIQAIQYLPIPRLEIAVPEIDLLLENLILEPGRTINNTSFFPFRLKVETHNEVSIHKARFRTVTSTTSVVCIKLEGMSIRADDIGFWFRAHKGLVRFADQGIASFELDDRGFDVELDVEIGKDRLENILSLRAVRVKIHHLSYTLSRSRFACLAWVFKPLLRPIFRRVLEQQIAATIENFFRAANRELLFARERLRATRIADPKDLSTFVKALLTRLTPAEDPDLYASVGVTGGSNKRGNVFAGVYAPGSVVKLWNEQAASAGEVVDDNAVTSKGWRNEIFDVQTVVP